MSLLNEASFLVTPNSYKEDKLYAAIPTNGNGDMTFTRTGTATRVNEAGLVELVPYNLFPYSEDFSQWNIFRSTLTSNATTSPDGTINADLVNQNYPTTSVHGGVSRTKAVSTGVKYTYSIFVKKKEYSWIELAESATSAVNISTWFDVENGVVGTVGAGSTAQIEDFGNDWYRCSISITSAFTGNRNFILYLTTGNNTATANKVGGAYIYGAQLVEGSSAKTYQKTVDRLDIPRIDYTDAKRTNLLTYSENFYDASFIKGLSLPIETDSTIAPDGTLTADTWTGNGASGAHFLVKIVSATSGVAYTHSVFAKKGTNDFIQILGTAAIYDSHSWANFDLESGDVGDTGTSATATITDFGDGWYRCTMTATATTTASGPGFTLRLITSADSDRAEQNSLATSVYLWGAQLEEGSYPTSYIPTHTMPVTIYDGCPSILLEPARINYARYSQQFDVSETWTQLNSPTITPNTHTAPDGTLTAYTFTAGAASAQIQQVFATGTSGVSYTGSVYIKRLFGSGNVRIRVSENTNTTIAVTSDWTRVSFTATSTTSNQIRIGFNIETIGDSVAIWGAQLEEGAYPTSYIPTTIGTSTRIADAVSKTGISDLINSEEGVFFIEFKTLSETGTFRQFNLSKDSGNRIYITKRGDNGNLEFRMANPSGNLNFSFVENTTNDFVKVAFRYGLNDFAVFIDGVNKNVTSTGNVFASGTLNTLQFDSPLSQPFFGKVKQLALFPTPLSNDQCIALTTL
jgi:hypothetical protein